MPRRASTRFPGGIDARGDDSGTDFVQEDRSSSVAAAASQ
jgi:hypothetical protein